MLHPVGPLPPAVYWRRRALVLVGTLGVLGGGGWLGAAVATGSAGERDAVTAAPTSAAPAPVPALEQVLPSLAAVQVPTPARTTAAPASAAGTPAGPVAGGPCSDDMIAVEVRPETPSAPVGGTPTFDLVVTNVSPVACVRVLDKGLQEIAMLDGSGNRVWGSNDCVPESSSDQRTLQPGESAAFPVQWSGLSSSPGCETPRVAPGAGSYVLLGRLDTKPSAQVTFTLT